MNTEGIVNEYRSKIQKLEEALAARLKRFDEVYAELMLTRKTNSKLTDTVIQMEKQNAALRAQVTEYANPTFKAEQLGMSVQRTATPNYPTSDPVRMALELADFMKAQVVVTTGDGILISVDRRPE